MGKHVQRISHKGKEIVLLDGVGLSEDEGVAAWDEMNRELRKERRDSLVLINASSVSMTTATVNKAKEAATIIKDIPDCRVVFVGLTGLQKSTAQLVAKSQRLNAHFCATLEEGKEWLVREGAGGR